MADDLNQQFQSVFPPAAQNTDLRPPTNLTRPKMKPLKINTHGVNKLLKDLNPNKATGPDGASARILKETADIVTGPLTNIYRKSIKTGTIPDDWRKANVIPIFKKGDKCKAENYRPISLTCIASEIIEHIVTSHLVTR